ncbi:MAG: hypothetical protein WKF40_01590 [Thermoleophilaceae bacterium]
MSYLLMPADPDLKLLAATVEEERRHALELDGALEERDEPVERAAAGRASPRCPPTRTWRT